jgi:membrane associated rhomboid family serine protease
VTYALIGLCVAIFFAEVAAGKDGDLTLYSFGFVPAVFFNQASLPSNLAIIPPVATLITHMFLHGNVLHLAGNLLYLWVFGNNVEEALGRVRFLIFYLVCGIAAAMTMGLMEPASEIPMVGASGAISGVLAAYLMLFPRARILVVIPLGFILYPAKLSAFWVLGAWFLLQLVAALFTNPGEPGIAWWAHFSGFICGLALVWLLHRPEHPLFGDVQIIPKGAWARQLVTPKDRRKPGRN